MTHEHDKPKEWLFREGIAGRCRTLLAFNLVKAKAKNLAGFTIQVAPDGKKPAA
jgi:hypothetical protein